MRCRGSKCSNQPTHGANGEGEDARGHIQHLNMVTIPDTVVMVVSTNCFLSSRLLSELNIFIISHSPYLWFSLSDSSPWISVKGRDGRWTGLSSIVYSEWPEWGWGAKLHATSPQPPMGYFEPTRFKFSWLSTQLEAKIGNIPNSAECLLNQFPLNCIDKSNEAGIKQLNPGFDFLKKSFVRCNLEI